MLIPLRKCLGHEGNMAPKSYVKIGAVITYHCGEPKPTYPNMSLRVGMVPTGGFSLRLQGLARVASLQELPFLVANRLGSHPLMRTQENG